MDLSIDFKNQKKIKIDTQNLSINFDLGFELNFFLICEKTKNL